ncbi:hypothetical protein HII36_40430 [Nonomuraea sp. NN258]|uniref:hypothetical protein n=1 Tax=Nonomuraea antri TaxID=2730852 RepID=UPI001569A79C|nr:hypothetical protein [Nonomuraea antri]NRQ38054.1 hypothetical protein [Nonomuraea antri]
MKRPLAALTLTAATLATALSLGSAAHAEVPGYVKQGSYGWPDQCLSIGYQGKINHNWSNYYCETITPTNWMAPGMYYLWVKY